MAFMINSWHFLPQEEIKDDLKTSRRSQGVEKITVTRRTQRHRDMERQNTQPIKSILRQRRRSTTTSNDTFTVCVFFNCNDYNSNKEKRTRKTKSQASS